MLLFRSDEHVARWCRDRGQERGATLSPEQGWALARAWYTGRLDPQWRPRTPQQAQAVLTDLGLTDPFWQLEP